MTASTKEIIIMIMLHFSSQKNKDIYIKVFGNSVIATYSLEIMIRLYRFEVFCKLVKWDIIPGLNQPLTGVF